MLAIFSFFFTLRSKQFYRILTDLGLVRVIIFVCFVLPLFLRYFTESKYLIGFYALLLPLIHLLRTDKNFLIGANLPYALLYTFEYLLLAFPALAFLLSQKAWIEIMSLLLYCGLVPFIPLHLKATNYQPNLNQLIVKIPAIAFEWRSNIRKNFPLFILFYGLGIAACQFVFTVPTILISFTLLTNFFYLECESTTLLFIVADTPKQLLWRKIKWQLILFWILVAPLVLLFLVIHPSYWFVIVYFAISSTLAQLLPIFYKYTIYEPALISNITGLIYMFYGLILLFIILMPFFIPVGLFALFRYYQKAIKNLSFYYN